MQSVGRRIQFNEVLVFKKKANASLSAEDTDTDNDTSYGLSPSDIRDDMIVMISVMACQQSCSSTRP